MRDCSQSTLPQPAPSLPHTNSLPHRQPACMHMLALAAGQRFEAVLDVPVEDMVQMSVCAN